MSANKAEAKASPETAKRKRGRPPSRRAAPPLPVPAEGEAVPSQGPDAGKSVGAVLNGIRILKFLSRAPAPVSLTHIVQELDMNTSTCFNILRTLAQEDYVRFDPVGKVYSIGLGVMELARGAATVASDVNVVRPIMERIAREHNVTVTLWRRISVDRMMLVLEALGAGNMRIKMSVGQRLPLLIGAAGRLMAAHAGLSRGALKAQFASIRWDHPLSFDAFLAEVEDAAGRGWALDNGNYALGTASVAVPILNEHGGPLMACTATMFINQYDPTRAERLAAELAEVSRALAPALPHL
ncbi:IclR family transcriptional regulator [Azospirillum sp. sgz302134]